MAPSPPRRTFLAGLAGGLAAVSGCVSSLGDSAEASTGADLSLDALRYSGGFGDETAALADRYGDHGVWGLSEGPDVDGPNYVGAWRDSVTLPGGRSAGDGRPWVTADAAAVVYRLDGSAYRVWLWTGARPFQPEGRLGRTSVTRLHVSITAGDEWSLVAYAPRDPVREGPVPVGLDDQGPTGRTPLPGGGVAPDGASTGMGPGGGVAVAWQGIGRGTRSVNAVCEFQRERDGPLRLSVDVGVAGGWGVL